MFLSSAETDLSHLKLFRTPNQGTLSIVMFVKGKLLSLQNVIYYGIYQEELFERLGTTFTANSKRRTKICVLPKMEETRLI